MQERFKTEFIDCITLAQAQQFSSLKSIINVLKNARVLRYCVGGSSGARYPAAEQRPQESENAWSNEVLFSGRFAFRSCMLVVLIRKSEMPPRSFK